MKHMLTFLSISFLVFVNPSYAEDNWSQRTPAIRPAARHGHGMVTIGSHKVLVFGGRVSGVSDETWVYDSGDNNWTLMNPSTRPSPREFAAMAYVGDGKVLMFGGHNSPFVGDTWIYDLSANTWTRRNPPASPSARYYQAMAYLGNGMVVMFGGATPMQNDETWIYDLNADTWTRKAPAVKPSARYLHAMASVGNGQAVLFGGFASGSISDETWVYDLATDSWTLKSPATKPRGRFYHELATLGTDRVLLFGGYTNTYNDETWVYDPTPNAWTQVITPVRPAGRLVHGMASLESGKVLLFGGLVGVANSDETWSYESPQPLSITCPADTTLQNAPGQCSRSLSFAATVVGSPPPTVEYRVGNDVIVSPYDFPVGTTTVNCIATNSHGSVTCAFAVTVQDTQHPSITGPGNMVVRPASPSGAFVDYQMPVGTDNCSAITTQTSGLPSGSLFPIGTTMNTFVATDPADNSATTGFSITVVNPSCGPNKVIVCHKGHELCVSVNALQAHLAHGDLLGPCSLGEGTTDATGTPADFTLGQNFPNPFNPTTIISFGLPNGANVNLAVFNALGQRVAQLVDGWMGAGYHNVTLTADGGDASRLSTGVYVYRLQTQGEDGKPVVLMKKMLLVK